MRQGIKTDVSNAVQCEYSASMEKFPLFSSAHEGYVVILEEVEEIKAEFDEIESHIKKVWSLIKSNLREPALEMIKNIGGHAQLLACEAIQVAAMVKKFEESSKKLEGLR